MKLNTTLMVTAKMTRRTCSLSQLPMIGAGVQVQHRLIIMPQPDLRREVRADMKHMGMRGLVLTMLLGRGIWCDRYAEESLRFCFRVWNR